MRRILLKKVTGFRVKDVDKPIIIRDKRGILFYDTTPLIPKVTEFNLPAHIELFVESGSFVPMEHPVKYKLSRFPKRQRIKKPLPFNFKVKFGDNPNKATIYWKLKTILFDNSFREKPIPLLFFVLYHEFGHYLYKTEHFADLFAKNMMLKKGYNPYQIGRAQITGLSQKNYSRKKFIVDNLINIQR